MRVGINALSIRHGVTGGAETYLHNLVAAMLKEGSDHMFAVLVRKGNREAFCFDAPNLHLVEFPAIGSAHLRIIYEQVVLPIAIRRLDLDVLHCPGNFSMVLSRVESQEVV